MKQVKPDKRAKKAPPRKTRPAKISRPRTVWLNVLPDHLWVKVRPGTTILDALPEDFVAVESDCGGLGKCGKCKVRVDSSIGPPCQEELDLLDKQELEKGIRLACRTKLESDMVIDILDHDREAEFYQILKAGKRPLIELDPLVSQRLVDTNLDPEYEWLSDLDRIKLVLGPAYSQMKANLSCLRRLPEKLHRTGRRGTVVLHEDQLLDWQSWDQVGHRYGLAFDLGTSTVVGKLIDLLDGTELSVVSRLNSQFKYGTNVVSRLQYVNDHANGLHHLSRLLVSDLNRIIHHLVKRHDLEPNDIYVAVAAGNTTMQHLLLELPPLGIAQAPFAPVLTDGMIVYAKEVGLNLNPAALLYVMPTRSGYVGGDLISAILASGAAEQNTKMVLGMDLGTNGEIFLGNSDRMLTCSAAAGPALEGARISHGMIARTGAIEGTSFIDDALVYRIIGNTKPKGLCGSGLADLVAVLLHWDVIDHEGLIRPTELPEGRALQPRVIERSGLYHFLVASQEESFEAKRILLTQGDVRELQLAKGAIAAGIQILMEDMRIGVEDIDRICMAGALGNYLNPLSALRLGLIPRVDPAIITSIGNAASAGASMVLLSRPYWKKANELSKFIEHVELSNRLDFNDHFVEHLDFPTENAW